MIRENLIRIQHHIQEACEKSHRKPSDVSIIAVTKTIPLAILQANLPVFLEQGISVFGENRVQELLEKYDGLAAAGINWHMIGNLQRNKVKYIADKVALIHSLDGIKLATEINRIGEKKAVILDTLIEVNIAGENSKHGVSPDQLMALANACGVLKNLRIKGLMTVAPFVSNPDDNRKHFKQMYTLFQQLKEDFPDTEHLSMGMTGDYMVAVEEGATMVRIGTGIFGNRI